MRMPFALALDRRPLVVRHVTTEEDPDLFWALRGGGGDFGIITAITIRMFAGSPLCGGRLFWPLEQMPAVLRAFRDGLPRSL